MHFRRTQQLAAILTLQQLLCLLLHYTGSVNAQTDIAVGEECIVQRTNSAGICRLVSECPSVIDDIRNKRGTPTKCGFVNRVQVVCCPDGVKPKTTTTAAPSISAMSNHPKIAEKCVEYGEAVYSKEYVSSTGLDEPKLQRLDKCGHTAIELIVNGEAAKAREFPHMALIGYGAAGASEVVYLCGGSLVSDKFVLTAGHCIVSVEHGPAKVVRLGELALDSSNDEAFPEDFNIAELIPHPEYRQTSQYNDIALIKLDRKVVLSPYIRPICLPVFGELQNRRAIATGWGTIGYGEATSPILLKVVLDMFSYDECSAQFEANRKLKDGLRSASQICAGSRNTSKDTCQGDSGGPLQIYNDANVYCTYTIIGVTSFGKYCGLAGSPGVYTKVYTYISWIENLIFS